jgi:hypothetical protein
MFTIQQVKDTLGVFVADLYRRSILLGMHDVVEEINDRMSAKQ